MDPKIQKVVLHQHAASSIRAKLQERLHLGSKLQDVSIIRRDSTLGELTPADIRVDKKINQPVLYLRPDEYEKIVKETQCIQNTLDEQVQSKLESTDDHVDFTVHENATHHTLTTASNLLERLFNRRNGLSSWIFSVGVGVLGLITKDDYQELGQSLTDKDFVKKFARYLDVTKNGTENTSEHFSKTFGEKGVDRKKANLVLAVKWISEKLPKVFIDFFPKVFTCINIFTPFAQLLSEGSTLGKILGWVRVANPFIDDFANSAIGLCGDEMKTIKDTASVPNDRKHIIQSEETTVSITDQVTNSKLAIGEIELCNLDTEGREVTKAINAVSSAFKRLTRPRNASGTILSFLWGHMKYTNEQGVEKGYEDYEEFERVNVLKPKFTKAIYDHLQGLKENASIQDVMNVKGLENKHQTLAARVLLGVMTIGHNLFPWVVKEFPKVFGLPYSILYLSAPLLHKFLGEKGGLGKIVNFGLMFLPFINDTCVDILASAAEEAQSVKDIMSEHESLFEKLPKGDWKTVKATTGMIWDTIKSFRNNKQTQPEVGLAT